MLSLVFLLVPGTHSSIDNQLSLLSLSARRAIAMPLSYVVESFGRTGAELRVARGAHDLIATGASSRLGLLLPGHTTTTVATPDGRPLEVRLPFLLASWLLLGTLTVHVQVGVLLVYEHMIGAERLGAALDLLLSALTNNEPLTPSVLRRHLLRLAATMRPEQPVPLTVTVACLLVVGGNADNLECGALATPIGTPPLDPNWFSSVTFNMLLCPDGTLTILSELEGVLAPRLFPAQRAVGGGFGKVDALLVRSLTADEAAIILALDDAGQAEQYSQLIVTLLPSAPELLAYSASSASASLALARTLARATSTAGPT